MKSPNFIKRACMTAFRCCACLKRDRFFMLYGVVICLVMYGSELVNSPVGVDDDLFLALPENEVFWCTQGRFVPYLFLKILHQYPFVPGFSLLSSLVASLLAFEIIFFTYDRRLNVLKYLTFPIFCACLSRSAMSIRPSVPRSSNGTG